jgi:cold shock CspA family protein
MIGDAPNADNLVRLRACPRLHSVNKNERTKVTDTKVVGRIIKVSKAGWGFISSKDIEFTRIFFHWTALRQDTVPFLELKTGMIVEFTPLQIPGKGYRAVHVRVIEKQVNNASNVENESGVVGTTEI